ncbi:hypothetical protein M8C21_001935, partial [Ambrosia artemisiifolia]
APLSLSFTFTFTFTVNLNSITLFYNDARSSKQYLYKSTSGSIVGGALYNIVYRSRHRNTPTILHRRIIRLQRNIDEDHELFVIVAWLKNSLGLLAKAYDGMIAGEHSEDIDLDGLINIYMCSYDATSSGHNCSLAKELVTARRSSNAQSDQFTQRLQKYITMSFLLKIDQLNCPNAAAFSQLIANT